MSRIHTIWTAEKQAQEDIPFTAAEEAARDVEEAEAIQQAVTAREEADRLAQLNEGLRTDNLTHQELLELLRLERNNA